MATKPVVAKLRLRLELIAALPEPILLDRQRRLSVAELILFRRFYGIRECRCKGPCKVQHFMLRATSAAKLGRFAPACCSASLRAAQQSNQHVPDAMPVRGVPAADPA